MLCLRTRNKRSSAKRAERLFPGERDGRKARWVEVLVALRRLWLDGSVMDCWGEVGRCGCEEPNQSSWDWKVLDGWMDLPGEMVVNSRRGG